MSGRLCIWLYLTDWEVYPAENCGVQQEKCERGIQILGVQMETFENYSLLNEYRSELCDSGIVPALFISVSAVVLENRLFSLIGHS